MKLLHKSHYFSSYQCDNTRRFYVDFNHKLVKFRLCQLLALRHQVQKINLEAHFNGNNEHGLEIFTLCNKEHLFVFNTIEVLDLLDLVKGTFTMLELNSMITSPS